MADFRQAQLNILSRSEARGPLLFPEFAAWMLVDEWFMVHHGGRPPELEPRALLNSLMILFGDERYRLVPEWPCTREEMEAAVFGPHTSLAGLYLQDEQVWDYIGVGQYNYRTPIAGARDKDVALTMPRPTAVRQATRTVRKFNSDGSFTDSVSTSADTFLVGPDGSTLNACSHVRDGSWIRRTILRDNPGMAHVKYSDDDEVRSCQTWAALLGLRDAKATKLSGHEADSRGDDVVVEHEAHDGTRSCRQVQVKTLTSQKLRAALSTGRACEVEETAEDVIEAVKAHVGKSGDVLLLDGHYGSLSRDDFAYLHSRMRDAAVGIRFTEVWYLSSVHGFCERL